MKIFCESEAGVQELEELVTRDRKREAPNRRMSKGASGGLGGMSEANSDGPHPTKPYAPAAGATSILHEATRTDRLLQGL